MKNIKVFALALVAAFAIVSCNNVEKILPKKDGLWQATSLNSKTYLNNVLELDVTQTDSLGTIRFDSDGTGESFAFDGTSDGTFTWSFDSDEDKVTITQDGTTLVYEVLESERKSQKWFTSVEFSFGNDVTRFDITQSLERVD